jgi:TRAP-type uncharacterized transport system substrate-binding protein
MMSIVEKGTGISSSNRPGGGVGNCKAVNGGRADLGWTYTHTAYNAYSGRGKFNKKSTNLRHLMSLYPGVFQMAVPKKSKINSVADLKDKRIVPGKISTGSPQSGLGPKLQHSITPTLPISILRFGIAVII